MHLTGFIFFGLWGLPLGQSSLDNETGAGYIDIV
jgi:hypothetical protein